MKQTTPREIVLKFVLENYMLDVTQPCQNIGMKMDMDVKYEQDGMLVEGKIVDGNGNEDSYAFKYEWNEVLQDERTGTLNMTEILDILRCLSLLHRILVMDCELVTNFSVDIDAVSKMTDEFQSEFCIPTMAFKDRRIEADHYTREGLNLGR